MSDDRLLTDQDVAEILGVKPSWVAEHALVREPEGYFAWLLAEGTEIVTTHHLAALSGKRVRDVEFVLACEGVPIDRQMSTVKIRDFLEAGLV